MTLEILEKDWITVSTLYFMSGTTESCRRILIQGAARFPDPEGTLPDNEMLS